MKVKIKPYLKLEEKNIIDEKKRVNCLFNPVCLRSVPKYCQLAPHIPIKLFSQEIVAKWKGLKEMSEKWKFIIRGFITGQMLRHWTNWSAVRMILPTWFDHLEESFSYKEVQFK